MPRRRPIWIAALAIAAIAPAACVLGPNEPPGCQSDADCEEGSVCRAGACFRTTTDRTPPDEADGGDGGD
jgi:hypothetical protein